MKSFLSYVAQDLIARYGHNMSDIVVVFPNKRASLFLGDHLARLAGSPVWSPTYITISQLFRHHSPLLVADPIKLVCDLYKTFAQCTGTEETLDHFYGWGQLLIADFDDIDKNMADARQLFANLQDIHELDDISYLTEEQKAVIQRFFSNFTEDHNSELKRKFLQLWSNLGNIYQQFNTLLASQGLAYEGALYRQVAEDKDIVFEHKKYIFVGFNMMQTVELKLCERLAREGKAEFYWDYDHYYMKGNHEAGHYIRQYLEAFPGQLDSHPEAGDIYRGMEREKDITYVSASTENIQARYVHQWLLENDRWKAGRKTAIVLADENLLTPVIHSLPEQVESVNITIGYPLQQSPFYSLIRGLLTLQTAGHPKGSNNYRLHFVLQTLRHPYAIYISEKTKDVIDMLEEHKQFYPTRETLALNDEALRLLFADLEAAEDFNLALLDYLLQLLRLIGVNARSLQDPLFQESLFRTYTLINRLADLMRTGDLHVDTTTLERLIQQLVQTTSIPFHGEPIEGIQIMGVLETRNLDFDHVLVLSCNEGNIPKGVTDSSFIPYSLRKAYGLTTIDHKVAIYAYYFHRLLQRASDITLAYNSATESGHTGEMSRFMMQMLVESTHHIKRYALTAAQKPLWKEPEEAPKDETVMSVLSQDKFISPTYLNTYLRCQKRFYYRYILGLKEPDETDDDEVDKRVFGNIFHRAAQLFYLRQASPDNITTDSQGKQQLRHPVVVSAESIKYALGNEKLLYDLIDQAFREELFKVKATGYRPTYNGLQLINREVIKRYLQQLLQIDLRLAPFTVIGLEINVSTTLDVALSDGQTRTFRLGGIIDRLDAVAYTAEGSLQRAAAEDDLQGVAAEANLQRTARQIRVIDYKTGTSKKSKPAVIGDLFDDSKVALHTDYYLQTLLYASIVGRDRRLNPDASPVAPALLFIQSAGAENYNPILSLDKQLISDASIYDDTLWPGIAEIIAEINNPHLAFLPTPDKQRCGSCPFAALCK